MSVNAGVFTELDLTIKNKDYLATRVIIKRLAKSNLKQTEWKVVRGVLQNNPQVGWNLLTAWDNRFIEKFKLFLSPDDKKLTETDQLALAGKFSEAFQAYQNILRKLKSNEKDNYILIQQVMHRMGRTLYAIGKYSEALTVYDWIGNDYLFLKQVLFEKTWAAFRGNKIDRALGLIASLHSTHYKDSLEPEILLLQLYIYKRLCRDKEAEAVLKRTNAYLERLKAITSWQEWAKSDAEYLYLLRSLDKPLIKVSVISESERNKEQTWIRDYLEKQFKQEKARILEQGSQVAAYMNLAIEQSPKELIKIEKLPNKENLLNSGMHFWDSEDAEEWSDEIGKHYFIGDSLCGKSH
jgi:hypothetical protein